MLPGACRSLPENRLPDPMHSAVLPRTPFRMTLEACRTLDANLGTLCGLFGAGRGGVGPGRRVGVVWANIRKDVGGGTPVGGFAFGPHPPCPRVRRRSQESMLHRHGSRGARCTAARQPADYPLVVSGALSYSEGIESALIEIPIGYQTLRVLEPAQCLLRLWPHGTVNGPRVEAYGL